MIHVDRVDALELLDRAVAHVAIGERKLAELGADLANERRLTDSLKKRAEEAERVLAREKKEHQGTQDVLKSFGERAVALLEGLPERESNESWLVHRALSALERLKRERPLEGELLPYAKALAAAHLAASTESPPPKGPSWVLPPGGTLPPAPPLCGSTAPGGAAP